MPTSSESSPRDLEPPAPSGGADRTITVLVVVSVAIVIAFVGFMLAATNGHFVPQVVDLYVVCQYAKAMAEGHPFQYNPGEPPSTGATSLLHTAILALAYASGARGEALIAFAIGLGAALYVGSVLLARRIGVLLGDPSHGLLSAGLVALGGPVVWGYLYGSDVALFMFLALWVLDRWLALWRGGAAGGLALAASLLAVARPEGLPIALFLGACSFLGPRRGGSMRERLLLWVPTAAAVVLLLVQRAMTGSWLGSSVGGKTLLPNYGWADTLRVTTQYAVDVVRGLLLGLYPSDSPIGFASGWGAFGFPPFALVLILLALIRAPSALRLPLRLWAALVVAVFAVTGPNVFMGVHFNRYLMWAFPGLLVLTAVGVSAASRLLARDDTGLERSLFRAGAGLFLGLGLLSTLHLSSVYGQLAGDIYRREVPTAEWIANNLPRGVAMANLSTSIEYLTGHRNISLHGVTTPAFVGNRLVEKEAGLFESLNRFPRAELPPYLIVSSSGLEGSALYRELVEGPPLYQSTSLGDDLLVFRARWELVGKSARPLLPQTQEATRGLTEVDRLNVCDVQDEAAHGYHYSSGLGDLRLAGTVRIDAYETAGGRDVVADSGRPILGEERFRVRTGRGRDLTVVLRTNGSIEARAMRAGSPGSFGFRSYAIQVPEAGFVVRAEGQVVGRFSFRNGAGWNEHVFRLPGNALREGGTNLALSGRYASFHYWFFQ